MRRLAVGSVCSGIGAPEVAWKPLGWQFTFCSEIEPFPSAVLKHHHSEVPNLGDFTAIGAGDAIGVLVRGTPCQDFSVAGNRAGLDGDRGQLTIEFVKLVGRLRPRWVVWENVPGVLSDDGGRSFGIFLGKLGQLGYGFAYRILDAQYFGVAQRRRRVFVVGYFGDWRRAAAVLFERQSLSWNPAPRRESRQGIAEGFTSSSHGGYEEGCGTMRANGGDLGGGSETLLANPLGAKDASGYRLDLDNDTYVPAIAGSVAARDYKGARCDIAEPMLIAFDDQRGRENGGVSVNQARTLHSAKGMSEVQLVAFAADDYRAMTFEETTCARPLTNSPDRTRSAPIVASPLMSGSNRPAGHNARSGHCKDEHIIPCGFIHPRQTRCSETSNQVGIKPDADVSDALTQEGLGAVLSFEPRYYADGRLRPGGAPSETVGTLKRSPKAGDTAPHVAAGMAVRRLTPRECERLQGFPDDYTLIPYKGKLASDGPRYRALGNSMAVPVMRWIGERIAMVDALT
jgi:DNA (cytosine-5)-methyltransferase 1